jgi:hypothetical protein
MANHPNRKPSGDLLQEGYVIRQAGFLLLEVSKMMDEGALAPDYEKHRKSARRAAIRAAKVLESDSNRRCNGRPLILLEKLLRASIMPLPDGATSA